MNIHNNPVNLAGWHLRSSSVAASTALLLSLAPLAALSCMKVSSCTPVTEDGELPMLGQGVVLNIPWTEAETEPSEVVLRAGYQAIA